ncbi:EamA family transporter [Peteryoungia desertarenae]|uniref:EamA family transporter n=1 Tax=Peteryoungia desertarenae TaxID=1813451 RepID=A0ABX6QQH6_9HYPH|nr:DMT family transporter [Peteryoungia desertarenae]QLF70868.1 EamA family transporter [Peteryoungia desertarenae]
MTTRPSLAPTPKTWGLLILLGFIWGGSFFLARYAVGTIPPFTLVFLRLSLAALVLHIYLMGRHQLYGHLKRLWQPFLLLGLLNNAIPHTLIFFGQTEIGAGLAAILNATTPIWTVLIANRLTSDEKLSRLKIAGTMLGLAGTAVLIGPGAFVKTDIPHWALILPILAAMSYGLAATYGKRFRDVPPEVTATGQMTASAIIILPVCLLADAPWTLPAPSLTVIAAVLGLALVSTAYGYILFFKIMAQAGATNTSLVTLLVPPSAILLGFIFLNETLHILDVAGMVLIGLGLVVLDGRLVTRVFNQRSKTSP